MLLPQRQCCHLIRPKNNKHQTAGNASTVCNRSIWSAKINNCVFKSLYLRPLVVSNIRCKNSAILKLLIFPSVYIIYLVYYIYNFNCDNFLREIRTSMMRAIVSLA